MSVEPRELYSLLIPLQSERLLVPRMCVAEVIAFADTARTRDDAAPDWYLGAIEWNNRRLPVVTFDAPRTHERKNCFGRIVLRWDLSATKTRRH